MMLGRGALVTVAGLASVQAAASGTPTIVVGPGDGLNIRGSNIECAVSTSAPRAMICGLGGQQSLLAKSYAFTVADRGAAIFVATGNQRTVARQMNPPLSGAPFKGPGHKPVNYVLAQHEHVIVAGTHIACGALLLNGLETFGCGAYDTSTGTSGYYVTGTYAVTISDHYVGILRAGGNGAQTVVAIEKQP
jgi:hypothetical protein